MHSHLFAKNTRVITKSYATFHSGKKQITHQKDSNSHSPLDGNANLESKKSSGRHSFFLYKSTPISICIISAALFHIRKRICAHIKEQIIKYATIWHIKVRIIKRARAFFSRHGEIFSGRPPLLLPNIMHFFNSAKALIEQQYQAAFFGERVTATPTPL